MKLLGFLLLIAAGGYAGASLLYALDTQLRQAERLLAAAETMRTEILFRRTPLPAMAERLSRTYPDLLPGMENASRLLADFSFDEVWRAAVRCAALPGALEEPLLLLGGSLSAGAEPERALTAFTETVKSVRGSLREKRAANARLYPSLGIAAGCMLALLLL